VGCEVRRFHPGPCVDQATSQAFYQAARWNTAQRVVAKIEVLFGELFLRVEFIVTNWRPTAGQSCGSTTGETAKQGAKKKNRN
jgi:hypothetical protein